MIFVGFHLLLIINLVDTMKNVLRSITTHADQLAQTFIFAFLLLFFIAMITAINYADMFDDGVVGPAYKDLCPNMVSCWLQTIDIGMRLGGSLGDAQKLMNVDESGYMSKWTYNMFNFFMFAVIIKNVIQGIMIDTFEELRAQQTEKGKILTASLTKKRAHAEKCLLYLRFAAI